MIMNRALVVFALSQKLKGTDMLVQPNLLMTRLKILMSVMKQFGIPMCFHNFKGFSGCLDAMVKEAWRKESLKRPDFGT